MMCMHKTTSKRCIYYVPSLYTEDDDFTGVTFTLNFDEDIDEICRDIPIIDDVITEIPEETFVVTLQSNDPQVTVGPPSDATIVDNDRKFPN